LQGIYITYMSKAVWKGASRNRSLLA
jgi:hypothetical protein